MSVYDRRRPWETNEERLVTDALMANTMPSEEIATMVRPPLPQIRLFPPIFGLTSYQDRQSRIDDVIVAEPRPADFRSNLSGGEAGFMASARFVNGPGV